MRKSEDHTRDRCDHCRKWVSQRQSNTLGTLEGIVSDGVDINFSVCSACIDRKGTLAEYWDAWVQSYDQNHRHPIHPEWRSDK